MDENNEKKEDKKVDEKVETINENPTVETSYQPVDTVETTYEPKPIETSNDSILSSKEENHKVQEGNKEK